MRTYTEAQDYLNKGRSKTRRPLTGRATEVVRRDDGTIAIRYQQTDVVIYHPDGTATLNSGGWRTMTTKARINEYTHATVTSTRSVWYVERGSRPSLFYDGMVIDAEGYPVAPQSPDQTESARKRLDTLVDRFVRGYADAVCAPGAFPEPGPGDCLMCQIELGRVLGQAKPLGIQTGRFSGNGHLTDTTGQAEAFSVDHYLSHMAEGYHVPSLYALACVARRYGGGPGIGWQMGITRKDRAWVLRDLRYYFKQPQRRQALLALLEQGWQPEGDV